MFKRWVSENIYMGAKKIFLILWGPQKQRFSIRGPIYVFGGGILLCGMFLGSMKTYLGGLCAMVDLPNMTPL